VAVSSVLLRDERRREIGCVFAIQDMREVTALRSRLVTAGRLAAVGELAAGIAHEINNPVTFVRANLVHLRQQWSRLAEEAEKAGLDGALEATFAEGIELIEESVEGVDRIGAVVRDVGAFAHAGLGRPELADVNQLLETAANVAALHGSVTIERCYAELPPVRCAPHQLRQLFLNLLFNALQAVDGKGRIRLRTQAANGSVFVRVEDDGCGMPPEVVERIFDPFFTTRPAGSGTGLGLSLAYQIAHNHAGEISVESSPGRGSSFQVRLPAAGA
jgi:two-component system NtrC family sensor kinase